MHTQHDPTTRGATTAGGPGHPRGNRSSKAWAWILGLLVLAALVIGGFFLLGGDADVDVDGGDVDVEAPQVDTDLEAPDVDVNAPDISLPDVDVNGGEIDPGGIDVQDGDADAPLEPGS